MKYLLCVIVFSLVFFNFIYHIGNYYNNSKKNDICNIGCKCYKNKLNICCCNGVFELDCKCQGCDCKNN